MTQQNLTLIPTVNVNASIASSQVGLHTKPVGTPAVVKVAVNWNDYGISNSLSRLGVRFSLLSGNQSLPPLDAIRSVKIDNSYCAVPVYLTFPDTGDVITCPPFAIVQTPVLTNSFVCVLYGDGFYTGRPPVTTVEFFNGVLEPLFIPGSLIDKVNLFYAGSTAIASTVNQVLAFPAITANVRPPSSSRLVTAAILSYGQVVGNYGINGLSCNGVAMVLAATSGIVPAVGTPTAICALFYAIVPTLTTLTFTATFSNVLSRGSKVFATCIENYSSAVPLGVITDAEQNTNRKLSANINTIPGAGLFAASFTATIYGTAVWTGANLIDYDSLNTLWEGSAALMTYSDNNYQNVNILGNNLVGADWI